MAPRSKSVKDERHNYGMPAEEFIRIWAESASVEEVSRKTGMPADIIYARVSGYRRRGIELKKMKRASTRRLDIAYLNSLFQATKEATQTQNLPPEIQVIFAQPKESAG